MSSEQTTPTEGGPAETARLRPLGRELALAATLHGVFGIGDAPRPSIARYRIERRLGVGGMSEVFLAEDPELRRRVAIKVLNHRFAADEAQRLMQEGWALASLKHPAIVAVHDVGLDRGRAFLVMEHVEGQTLDAWLAARPRRLVDVLRLFAPICEGLALAHDRGVVHRDLKPRNLLVGPDDRAKVIDFGLVAGGERGPATPSTAALVPGPGALTRDGALAGTPAYMSPEQASERAGLDGRSDLFSLAIVIYEAAFGERPFQGKGLGLLDAIVLAPPRRPRPRGLRARMLWSVLRRALAKDPADRHPDLRSLGAALQRVIDRPRRAALAVAAGIALAAAVIGGTTILPTLRARECRQSADVEWSELAAITPGPLRERLGRYRGEWAEAWDRGCALAHQGGALSVDVGLPLRQGCLREAGEVVGEAIALVGAGDEADRREREGQLLLAELPSIAACEASPTARGRRPHAPAEDAAIAEVELAVREAEARFLIGEITEAEAAARRAVERAALVRHRWTRARARLTLGRILRRIEAPDAPAIVAILLRAANEAIADHDRILGIQALQEAARGAVLLAHDADAARALLERAEGELLGLDEIAAPLGPELWASQEDIGGLVAYERGDVEGAAEGHGGAIRRLEGVAGLDDEGTRLLAAAWLNLGRALGDDDDAARSAFDRAYEIMRRIYGGDHSSLAVVRHSQALAAHNSGQPLLALSLAEEALALARSAGKGAMRQQARSSLLLGLIQVQRQEYGEALDYGILSEQMYLALGGDRGLSLLQARRLIAVCLRALGRNNEAEGAEELLEEQSILDETLDLDDRVDVLLDRAKARIDQRSPREALRLLDSIDAVLSGHDRTPSMLAVRGWALADAGRPAESISLLEAGIDGLTSGNQRAERARSEWILAETLIATNGDPGRICALLDSCRRFYAAPGQDRGTLESLDELRSTQRCAPPTPKELHEARP